MVTADLKVGTTRTGRTKPHVVPTFRSATHHPPPTTLECRDATNACGRHRRRVCGCGNRCVRRPAGGTYQVHHALQKWSDRCSRDQSRAGHALGTADRLHRDPCRSGRRGRRRCSRVRSGNDRNGPPESSEPGPAGSWSVPLRRQRVRARCRDRGPQVPLRTEDWFRDSRCKSANRPGRDYFRSRRRQPARHLAHGRLWLSRGRRCDGRGCGRRQRRRGRRRHGWQDGRRPP